MSEIEIELNRTFCESLQPYKQTIIDFTPSMINLKTNGGGGSRGIPELASVFTNVE